MGNRSKNPRVTHPLMVAAYALIRATDPANPSRSTVLRLLGDALHALQESHLRLLSVKARLDASMSNKSQPQQTPASRHQIEADSRFRQSHNEGARALFSVTITALLKLPSRGGPLRRRAIDLLHLASMATGPASAMAAVDRIRSHLSSLKRTSWSETDHTDFEISAIVLTLAQVSTCSISSRDVAKESIHFLVSQSKVQQKCRRGDLCHALAIILSSFPQHAPPEDRLVDLILEYVRAPNVLKQGLSMFGGPLLVSVICPFVVSRGPAAGDEIAIDCARTLKIAPTPTERAMWALALARAVVTARRSSTYQLRKYGNSEIGSKFPKGQLITSTDSENNLTSTTTPSSVNSESDASLWVSNEIFEEALVKVASMTGLEEGSNDASIAISSVLRMWLLALPESISVIVPRALVRLTSNVMSINYLSVVVDSLWLGVLRNLKPSQSVIIFESMVTLISELGPTVPAALSLCATLIDKFGRQALRESGLSTEYNTNTSLLIKRIHDALESTSNLVRICGIQAMLSVLYALPRSCSQFVTAVLQNLRIADLNIVTKPAQNTPNSSSSSPSTHGLNYYDRELAPLLGNGAALSILVEKLTNVTFSVPTPLYRQCLIDALALLKPHAATKDFNSHSPIVACVRRRVGWGIIAGLARGERNDVFQGESLDVLVNFWKEELKYGGSTKLSRQNSTTSSQHSTSSSFTSIPSQSSSSLSIDGIDFQMNTAIDEALARSSTRAAALHALSHALKYVPSTHLKECGRALTSASAARVVSLLSNINSSSSSSSSSSITGAFMGFGTEHSFTADSAQNKKRSVPLIQALALESLQLVQVAGQIPPSGDAGELCFLVAIALAEESQRAFGEIDSNHVINTHLTHSGSSSSRSSHYEGVFSNHMKSVLLIKRHDSMNPRWSHQSHSNHDKKETSIQTHNANDEYDFDISWLFNKSGLQAPLAERTMIFSAKAIAAIIAEDLSAHGSLIESLPSAKLSPPMCAAISLEMTKRLSRSDLAEINRALAVLQVLVRRSLGITGGVHQSLLAQKKNGRLYTPSTTGDSRNRSVSDIPGIFLQEISRSDGSLNWSRTFSEESHLAQLPFHNYHSRALGMMHATRTLASEAVRELSITGGPTLWIGLTKKVIELVHTNIEGATPTEFVTLSNALATLGALLEVIPDEPTISNGSKEDDSLKRQSSKASAGQATTISEMCTKAMNIIIEAIEIGKSSVQAASVLALSNRSHLVASSSERLTAALLRGWATDKGIVSSLGHFGRYAEEVNIWNLCFARVWSDMGIRDADTNSPVRFFQQDSNGFGNVCNALLAGTTSVLEACRSYWWPVKESSIYAIREFATDLIQWDGNCCHASRTAGLNCLIAIWCGKIDIAQVDKPIPIIAGNGLASHLRIDSSRGDDEKKEVDNFTGGEERGIVENTDDDEAALLPIENFSLKDPSRITSPVGPFLDEIIYRALAPAQHELPSHELSTAATTAVSELIRGLGVRRTCENLPRLPETLFGAVEDRIAGAQRIMNALVLVDAPRRPRYWFGLCRAVTLGNERLNYGTKGTVWDTSFRTKAYSVRVAVDAVDYSMADACTSGSTDVTTTLTNGSTSNIANGGGSTVASKQPGSAFGFLRKIFDFAKQVSSAASFDYESCGHGCRLLQRIAARVGSAGALSDTTLADFLDMWDPCVAMMHTLLVDRVPHGVLNSAAMAVSELLVSCLKLQRLCAPSATNRAAVQRSVDTVSSYTAALIESDVRHRLRYADQCEDVGMRAILALISKYGRIVSALNVRSADAAALSPPGADVAKLMFFALSGDFVAALYDEGLPRLAAHGGSFTAPHVDQTQLFRAMSVHIAPIVMGAISCTQGLLPAVQPHPGNSVLTDPERKSVNNIQWENKESIGVKMARNNDMYEGVTYAALVWLMTHDHSNDISMFKRQTFCDQVQETLDYIFRIPLDEEMQRLRMEIRNCFSKSHKSEGLKFVERMSLSGSNEANRNVIGKDDKWTADLIDLTFTILLISLQDEFGRFEENESTSLCRGLDALKNILSKQLEEQKNTKQYALNTLDVLFQMACSESVIVVSVLAEDKVLERVCELVRLCLQVVRESDDESGTTSIKLAEVCEDKVWQVFEAGCTMGNHAMFKVSSALGATLCDDDGVVRSDLLYDMIVHNDSAHFLEVVLACPAVEDCISAYIQVLTNERRDDAVRLIYALGAVASSDYSYSIATAFRLSVAAILADGAHCDVVNRMGAALYSFFLARLVHALPTVAPDDAASVSPVSMECATYFVEMVEEEADVPGSFVASLRESERKKAEQFLDLWSPDDVKDQLERR